MSLFYMPPAVQNTPFNFQPHNFNFCSPNLEMGCGFQGERCF